MSSMKKNVLAVALVAGLGLAGGAAAYNYGTAAFAPTGDGLNTTPDSSSSNPAGLWVPETVSYEMLTANAYNWTMVEDLVFDIQLPDNAVQVSTGYTVRVRLNRNNCAPSGQPYPAPDTTCVSTNEGAKFNTANLPAAGTGAGQLELNSTLVAAGWAVEFDGYYDNGETASIRIRPPAGTQANPGPGVMLRWHNPQLTSLDEFAAAAVAGTGTVNAEFWMVNATNDSRFQGSTQSRLILQSTRAVNACATPNGSEVDKYIDVADNFNEVQMPKTRFSWDGRLGSANDSSGGSVQSPDDYDSQVIDLGDVTLGDGSVPSFKFYGAGNIANNVADVFKTVIDATGSNDWNAFDNLGPDDDVYLVNGTCTSGTIVDQGEVSGSTVTFIYNADEAGMITDAVNHTGTGSKNLTVCGFVDEDIIIDDHNNHVTTTFYRLGMYPANGSAPGDTGTNYPTSGYASGVGSKTYGDPNAQGAHCDLLPLRYNGSTMEIFTINPASNTTQRSFVRLTNRSATDGYVSLEGIDNAGVRGASQVRVLVPAGASVQLDAADLENGTNGAVGAWGAPSRGKWRAIVTAEFPGLVASSLVNSSLPNVLTNITDSDTRGEQIDRDFAEGTWGSEVGQRPSDYIQEFEPDFRGDGNFDGEPGGPDANDGPAGGTTDECGNPGMDGSLPTNCTDPNAP